MKNLTLKLLPALLLAGLVNVYSISAATSSGLNDDKDKIKMAQDTVTTNKARAKRGVNELESGAKDVGKGTKDLAVSGAKATGKGAKEAAKAVKRTSKKGVNKVDHKIEDIKD